MSFPSRFMRFLLFVLLIPSPVLLRAQFLDPATTGQEQAHDSRVMYPNSVGAWRSQSPTVTSEAMRVPMMSEEAAESKSSFLGVLYSLALPGMGELYAGRFDKGKYPFITEIALWIGALGVDMHGDWVRDDARIFAQQHAGVDPAGKDDGFWVSIENYRDIHDYNNQRLIERRTEDVYPDEPAWQWSWDSEESRTEYKDQRIYADELHNAVTFFVLGMIANRIWSAIQAASSVRQYNASLTERIGSLPAMEPRLRSYAGRVDGIEFRFSW